MQLWSILTGLTLFVTVTNIAFSNERQRLSPNSDPLTHRSLTFRKNAGIPDRDWQFVVIHHSATSRGSVESINRDHRNRKDRNGKPWLGIGYHFVIGNGAGMPDGKISPTFRWHQQLHGAHSGSLRHNDRGIGVCLIGNFEETMPTSAQRRAITSLIRILSDRFEIPAQKVMGHKQIRATACPGRYFPFREVVKEGT